MVVLEGFLGLTGEEFRDDGWEERGGFFLVVGGFLGFGAAVGLWVRGCEYGMCERRRIKGKWDRV